MLTCRSAHPSFTDPTWGQKSSDTLSCGNRRDDHDHNGHCDSCDVCGGTLCPSDDGCQLFEGLAVHKACLLNDRRKQVVEAVQALIAAAAELNHVDEEALYTIEDPREDLASQAYDAIHDLTAWAQRNATSLAAVTK